MIATRQSAVPFFLSSARQPNFSYNAPPPACEKIIRKKEISFTVLKLVINTYFSY